VREQRIARERAEQVRAQTTLGTLSKRDIMLLGVGLYWGEGYKRANNEFGFSNSDPAMIKFYLHFLYTCVGVSRDNLIARVSINATHRNRIDAVEAYWRGITELPSQAFTKSSLIQTISRKIYDNPSEHYGVLRIKVRKGKMKKEFILGAIAAIEKQTP
jgi:hypothetical protein